MGLAGRVAVVSTTAIFRNRAGNAAYLASFCRVMRGMGFRVEVLFLDPIPIRRIHLHQHAEYLDSADTTAVRESVRYGSYFVTKNPEAWARTAVHGALVALGVKKATGLDRALRTRLWNLPWPSDKALAWAQRRLLAIRPDILVANYFNASRAFDLVGPDCCKAILTHDIFALRKRSYEASAFPLDFDEKIIAGESEALEAADLCLTITQGESDFVHALHPHLRTAVFPYVADIPPREPRQPPSARCVFVASDNDPNRRALAWLTREVWPRVLERRPEIELRVVGALARSVAASQPHNVILAGAVERLATEYSAASVALVPLRAGSGLKVKLIEALAHGVPVISTTVGAEGIVGAASSFLAIQDNPNDFAEAISRMVGASDWIARSVMAQKFASDHFSTRTAEDALKNAFKNVKASKILSPTGDPSRRTRG